MVQFHEPVKIDLEASEVMKDVNDMVVDIVSDLHPKWSVAMDSWHCMKSLPGRQALQLHRGFPVFETTEAIMKHDRIQASAFIAHEDDTRFLAVPGCFGGYAIKPKAETIEVKKGQLLIFRDLPHAGDLQRREYTLACLHSC
ncbi:hypothetical protein V7S43_009984 [Phytophthora oleae]|uniref:Uncharacterized protein n=1 Tax=Phytophthora oleae TaxID=2107226 RepID=A0ABD3FIJ6_9STRA